MNLRIAEGEFCLDKEDGTLEFMGSYGNCVYWEFEPGHWKQVAFVCEGCSPIMHTFKDMTDEQFNTLKKFIKLHA